MKTILSNENNLSCNENITMQWKQSYAMKTIHYNENNLMQWKQYYAMNQSYAMKTISFNENNIIQWKQSNAIKINLVVIKFLL